MKTKILLVEDHEDIANLVAINLRMLDLEVEIIDDGQQAYRQLHRPCDLAILDIMLPGVDGITLCKRLRQLDNTLPIMMLTSKTAESDLVNGLACGADDYLTKPFSVLELQARVKALLRRCPKNRDATPEPTMDYGPLHIAPAERQVQLEGQALTMTAKEFELLYFLARHPNRVYSREQLLSEIWGAPRSGSGHTVNSTVNRLRAKLEQDPAHPYWIQTVWGVGYKFAGESQC